MKNLSAFRVLLSIFLVLNLITKISNANEKKCDVDTSHLGLMKQYFSCSSTNRINACSAVSAAGVLAGVGIAGYKITQNQAALARKNLSTFLKNPKNLSEIERTLAQNSLSRGSVYNRNFTHVNPTQEIAKLDLKISEASNRLSKVQNIMSIEIEETQEESFRKRHTSFLSDKEGRPVYPHHDIDAKYAGEISKLKTEISETEFLKKHYQSLINDGRPRVHGVLFVEKDTFRSASLSEVMKKPSDYFDVTNAKLEDYSPETRAARIHTARERIASFSESLLDAKWDPSKMSRTDKEVLEVTTNQLTKSGALKSTKIPLEMSEVLASGLKSKAFRVVGAGAAKAVIGLAVLGTFMDVAYSASTGCSEINDPYVNMEVKQHGLDPIGLTSACAPGAKSLTSGTSGFLDLQEQEQERLLNNYPKICEYYKDWYREIFETRPVKLSCLGNSAEVTIKYIEDGKEKNVPVKYFFDSSGTRQVSINPNSEAEIKLQLDSNSQLVSQSYPGVALMTQYRGASDNAGLKVGSTIEKAEATASRIRPLLPLVTQQIVSTCKGESSDQIADLRFINEENNSAIPRTESVKGKK